MAALSSSISTAPWFGVSCRPAEGSGGLAGVCCPASVLGVKYLLFPSTCPADLFLFGMLHLQLQNGMSIAAAF